MHGWTVKKVYYYALSFILVAFIIYNVGQIVWRLSEIIVPPPILDLESRKVNTYSNWRMMGENIVYLAVCFPYSGTTGKWHAHLNRPHCTVLKKGA